MVAFTLIAYEMSRTFGNALFFRLRKQQHSFFWHIPNTQTNVRRTLNTSLIDALRSVVCIRYFFILIFYLPDRSNLSEDIQQLY